MEIRFFFLHFTIPHKLFHHPLRLGLLLGGSAWILLLAMMVFLPMLRGEKIDLLLSLAEVTLASILLGLFGSVGTMVKRRKIRTLREQHLDEDTILHETAIRKYTALQFNNSDFAGELILTHKRLQHFPLGNGTTFNSSLEDIQSATVIEMGRKSVLQVVRHDENACFVVENPHEWAYRIREAITAIKDANVNSKTPD